MDFDSMQVMSFYLYSLGLLYVTIKWQPQCNFSYYNQLCTGTQYLSKVSIKITQQQAVSKPVQLINSCILLLFVPRSRKKDY